MAKSSNQTLKLLYLQNFLLQKTDDEHGVTTSEIIAELKRYGICAERKTIYEDIGRLQQYGMDIVCSKQGKENDYRVGSRRFELAELKLLVDSVQSSRFITEKKSNELISKIETLTSQYEAQQLQRQVYVRERIKSENESIYYSVDSIHRAIADNAQIQFQYFRWTVEKERELRRNGAYYQVSPWQLEWDDENYYLVAYDGSEKKIKHFRVDKMLHIRLTTDPREGKELWDSVDKGRYAQSVFGMYGGQQQYVKLECKNELAGVIIDRFGKEVSLIPVNAEHFSVTVPVAVSNQFLGWVFALGDGARIIAPEKVVQKMQEEIRKRINVYGLMDT